jgi:sugar/nucleoside kinase (ribokinase family)
VVKPPRRPSYYKRKRFSLNGVGRVAGAGQISVDIYPSAGDVAEDYIPGESADWTSRDDQRLQELLNRGCEMRLGGNAVNVIAYLAVRGFGVEKVKYQGIAANYPTDGESTNDRIGRFIKDEMKNMGIEIPTGSGDYQPAVSIQERLPGGAAMSRDRPSSKLADSIIREGYSKLDSMEMDAFIVGSFLGEPEILPKVLEVMHPNAFATLVPGSEEYKQYPDALRRAMLNRNPDLLPLNKNEIRELFQDWDSRIEALVLRANTLANYVLCTLDKGGAYLAHNGDIVYGEAEQIDPKSIVDTTGAGDRAAAIATNGIMKNDYPEKILADIAIGTIPVLKTIGATADLDRPGLINS